MILQDKLIELVKEAGFIPTMTSDINKVNVLNQKKTMIGQFKILDESTLIYSSCLKKNKSYYCSFDELGVISAVNRLS